MGSKGSSTQTQAQQAQYIPNPAVQGAGYQALGQAQQAAAQPFNLPTQPVAGFSPQQQQAFQQYGQAQNIYQPYYNQAANYMQQSAAGPQTAQFMNPYANYVMANLREQQGQQMNQLTGQATQTAGGVGADRIGVAQGELARQQGLAQGQTLAGIYGTALQAAQQQQQLQQAAGYGMGQLGGANLQSMLGATGALYGSGAYQQQLQQAQLNAQYQNQLQRQAYPFQTAQYLANITSGLAGAMGANTAQQGYGMYTPPQPSMLGQIAGLGMAGAGAYGAMGGSDAFGGGNPFTDAYGGSASNPLPGLSASDYGARGGRFFADGGDTSADDGGDGDGYGRYGQSGYYSDIQPSAKNITSQLAHAPRQLNWQSSDPTVPSGQTQRALSAQQALNAPQITPIQVQQSKASDPLGDIATIAGDVAKIAPLFALKSGGRTPYPQAFADGGDVNFDYDFGSLPSETGPTQAFKGELLRRSVIGPKGDVDPIWRAKQNLKEGKGYELDNPYWGPLGGRGVSYANPILPRDRPPEAPPDTSAPIGSPRNPYRDIPPDAPRAVRETELPAPDEHTGPDVTSPAGVTPEGRPRIPVTTPYPVAARPSPTGEPDAAPSWREIQAANQRELQNYKIPYPEAMHDRSTEMARSPWTALMMAGLGTMASGSPWPGVAIGKGGMQGVQMLEKQRADAQQEEALNQRARQLQMEGLKYTSMTPAEAMRGQLEESRLEEGKWIKGDPNPVTGEMYMVNPISRKALVMGPNGVREVPYGEGAANIGAGGAGAGAAAAGQAGTVTPPPPAPQPPQPQQAQTAISPIGGAVTEADPESMLASGSATDAERNPAALQGITTKQAAAAARAAGNQEHKDIDKAAANADVSQYRLNEMKRDLNTIMAYVNKNPSGNVERALQFAMRPGPGAGNAVQMANWLSKFGTGVPPEVLAAAQTWAKNSTLAGFRGIVGEGLSAREAQPIIQASMGAVASMNLPEASSRALIASGEQLAQRAKDKQAFLNDYLAKNNYIPAGWEAQFEQKHPIGRYIANAVVSALPPSERAKLKDDTRLLRQRRDDFMKAEKSGDDADAVKARNKYITVKDNFNRRYGGTADYFAFGRM